MIQYRPEMSISACLAALWIWVTEWMLSTGHTQETLPEAKWTQDIESLKLEWFIWLKFSAWNQFEIILGPLCLWQCLHIYPPSGSTCISSNCGHQVAPLSIIASLATRWRHLHCHIGSDCLIGIISEWVGIFISQSHISWVSQIFLRDRIIHSHLNSVELI